MLKALQKRAIFEPLKVIWRMPLLRRKRKSFFIKNNMSGYINSFSVQSHVSIDFVVWRITNEDTWGGFKIKVGPTKWSEIWITCTPKHFKKSVGRRVKNQFIEELAFEGGSGQTIYEKHCTLKSKGLKFISKRGICH